VKLEPVHLHASPRDALHLGRQDADILKGLVERHFFYSGSALARTILDHFEEYLPRFVKVMPHEYRRALAQRAVEEAPLPAPELTAAEVVAHG